jgi:hypothetical protein
MAGAAAPASPHRPAASGTADLIPAQDEQHERARPRSSLMQATNAEPSDRATNRAGSAHPVTHLSVACEAR